MRRYPALRVLWPEPAVFDTWRTRLADIGVFTIPQLVNACLKSSSYMGFIGAPRACAPDLVA